MDIMSKEKRSYTMSRIRSKNTGIERIAFSELRKRGIYFQRHYKGVVGSPDIALPRKKKAVFIDGDFWHGYQFAKRKKLLPKKYWLAKIEGNIARDKKSRAALRRAGWSVLTIWENKLLNNEAITLGRIVKFIKS